MFCVLYVSTQDLTKYTPLSPPLYALETGQRGRRAVGVQVTAAVPGQGQG